MDVAARLIETHRHEWTRIVAGLVRSTRDFDLAEECAQEAFERALRAWTEASMPDNPGAWLMRVARNIAVDRIRRRATEQRLTEQRLTEQQPSGHTSDGRKDHEENPMQSAGTADDELDLIFTCCHPALSPESRIALTLRSVSGLTCAQIADAFLVDERTMMQRVARAKSKIRAAGITMRRPSPAQLVDRLDVVLAVLYLLFNEGYAPAAGTAVTSPELSREAIRLCRLVVRLLPDECEAAGLLALMELHDARRFARTDGTGALVTLEDQDRRQWDHVRIDAATELLDAALQRRRPGPYQLQAAIAACHATAAIASDTDWVQICGLYDRLLDATGSPVVALNRAVAVAMADGAPAGLRLVDELSGHAALEGCAPFHATRAELLHRAGRNHESLAAYRTAIHHTTNHAEREHLARRAALVDGQAN